MNPWELALRKAVDTLARQWDVSVCSEVAFRSDDLLTLRVHGRDPAPWTVIMPLSVSFVAKMAAFDMLTAELERHVDSELYRLDGRLPEPVGGGTYVFQNRHYRMVR